MPSFEVEVRTVTVYHIEDAEDAGHAQEMVSEEINREYESAHIVATELKTRSQIINSRNINRALD